jgi:hypothetical protein
LILATAGFAACAAGGVDTRTLGRDGDVVTVDGMATEVIIIPVEGKQGLFDVEAREGSAFAGGTSNQPLVFRARMRDATKIVVSQRFEGKTVRVLDEVSAQGIAKLWTRIEVRAP